MTAFSATPKRIVTAIERLPKHIQRQFLIDRMDIYLGVGAIRNKEGDGFKIIHMDNPEEAEELLQFRLDAIRNCTTIHQIFWFINKPDRLQFFQFLTGAYVFSKEDYAQLLRDVWIATEFPHQMSIKNLVRMFKSADAQFLMTDEERKALDVMPDVIDIYRGCQDSRAKVKALSWTTSYEVAHWFASRWSQSWSESSGIGKIYKSAVKKSDVYMYTNSRNENEVVVNPYRLKKMREVGVL